MTTDIALAGALPAPLPASSPALVPALARPEFWTPLRRGVAWTLCSLLLFAAMDVVQKTLAQRYPATEVMFFRSLFSALPLAVVLARAGGWSVLVTRRPAAHLVRSVVGALSVFCFIMAFSAMPLADVYAISFAGPLFVTALSAPLLGEAVRGRHWVAVGVGFLGVLVMLNPGGGMLSGMALLCVAGTLCSALATICVRRLARTEHNATIVAYFTLACAVLGGLLMLPVFVWPDAPGLAGMAVAGLLCTGAQLAMTQAYRLAPAALLAPLSYSSMLWAVLFGALLFGERPGWDTLLGTLIVMGGGLALCSGRVCSGRVCSGREARA